MSRWTCPACGREFGRGRQSHVCVPAGTIDDTFSGRRPVQRATFDAIMRHLDALGPVHLDAVRVGVFLKRDRKLAEVRPMARSLSLWLVAGPQASHPRATRSDRMSGDRTALVFRLTAVEDVDDALRDLLTEAFLLAGE